MICSCGRTHATLLAEKIDADKKAIEELRAQARTQTGAIKDLTEAKIRELEAELAAETAMKKALRKAKREIVANLKAGLSLASPEFFFQLTRDQLLEFVLRGGLGLAVDEFMAQQGEITKTIIETILETYDGLTPEMISAAQIDALQVDAADAVFQDVIIPDTLKSVREALNAISVDVPINQAMTALSARLEQSEGRQLTEVRTKLSQHGRAVTAQLADDAGLDLYLYTGPRDGITRGFCRALIDLVVDEKQMRRLNNGQGLPVKTSGGGYNCRHSWSPVTEGFVAAANLKRATAQDISKANAGA